MKKKKKCQWRNNNERSINGEEMAENESNEIIMSGVIINNEMKANQYNGNKRNGENGYNIRNNQWRK